MATAHNQASSAPGPDQAKSADVTPSERRPRLIGLRKRLTFTIVTGVFIWLICEVGAFFLSWLLTGRPFSWDQLQSQRLALLKDVDGPRANIVSEVHPYVGFVERPRAESTYRRFADDQPVPVSSFGYLDDKEPIQTRQPDRVIVGILGGSVACHFAINGSARLGKELGSSPEFAGKEFVFVNLALSGYKQPQQLMTLAYLLTLGAQFDLVVNIDGFNEVALYELENAGHHIFPAFPRSWQARISSADPAILLITTKLLIIEERRNALARWCSKIPLRYSVLCNLGWRLLRSLAGVRCRPSLDRLLPVKGPG